MTDNNIVSVLDCDVYFEKLKDRPEFIKFYLEFKSISIYLNKINTILELINGYNDNLELIGEQLEEMSNILLELYVDNSNSTELTMQKSNLVLYCDEIDSIVQNSVSSDITIFNHFKTTFEPKIQRCLWNI